MGKKPTRLLPAEGARNRWDCVPAHGQTIDDLLNPAYWSHVSAFLKPRDVIEVWAEDNSWSAELVVMPGPERMDRGTIVIVRTVWQHGREEKSPLAAVDDIYEVNFAPAQGHRWRVLRKADRGIMAKDFASKEAAEAHMRGLALPVADKAA